jgi:NodT family efflux transporter outer membrane factor (OMF) lipoprotein
LPKEPLPVATDISRLVAIAAATTLLGACTVGPDYQAPSPWSPASWFASRKQPATLASLPVNEPVDPDWWTIFHDPILTGLMHRVAASNLDVRTAEIRLAESRAQGRITGADQLPNLNGNASYTREYLSPRGVIGLLGSGGSSGSNGAGTSTQTSSNGLGGTQGGVPSSAAGSRIPSFNLFQAGFDSTWELDLWGRVRREVESANANIEASGEARRQTLVTSLAELARDYVQLRGIQETLRITQENLKSAQESARLSDERFRGGLATDLDVANARAQVESTAAGIPQLEQQQEQMVNAISFLLGEPPGALSTELLPPQPVPPVPPSVPIGLPSDLLQRRPDIRQAEAQLHAATADIGEAKAEFFPKISLSGSFALQAIKFKDLGNFGSRTFGLGPSVTIPIFEGGKLKGQLELREAAQKEAAINYQKSVLQAFHDVDNALIAYRAEQQRNDRLTAQAKQAELALGLAQQRFREGLSDFLEVLTAQRTLLSAQQQLADSTTTISTNLVALYKALGGGWQEFNTAAN